MSPKGRPEGEYRSAKHEGTPLSAPNYWIGVVSKDHVDIGVAGGYKAAIDPAAFTIVDNRLYLNYNSGVQKQWRADVPGFVAKADRNWPQVSRSAKVIE